LARLRRPRPIAPPALGGAFYWLWVSAWWRAGAALFRRLGNGVLVRRSGGTLLAKLEPLAHSLIDLGAVAAFIRRQGHYRIIDRGINRRLVVDGLVRPFPPQIEGVFVRHEKDLLDPFCESARVNRREPAVLVAADGQPESHPSALREFNAREVPKLLCTVADEAEAQSVFLWATTSWDCSVRDR
jgi:hypothetical protein